MKSHELQSSSEYLFSQECQLGCPAVSLAGHDKGEYFIVIDAEEEYVLLADGRCRTAEKPKRKKKKHVQICRQQLISQFPVTDEVIRKTLKNYVKNHCGDKEVKEHV